MANVLSRAIIAISANTAEFESGMQRINRTLNRQQRRFRRYARTLTAAVSAGFGAQAVREIAQAGIAFESIERSMRAAVGSSELASREMQFVRDESERLGLSLQSSASQFTKLAAAAKGTALEGEESRQIFTAISEASRVLGLTSDQTAGALTAIEQIISKGKVSAEELRGQLGERLPGAFQIAARSIGVSTSELDQMLKRGELLAEDLLPALARELRNTFGNEVESAAEDAAASFARFQTSVFELKVAIAESGLLGSMADLADSFTEITRRASAGPQTFTEAEIAAQDLSQAYRNLAIARGSGNDAAVARLEGEIERAQGVVTALASLGTVQIGGRFRRSQTGGALELFKEGSKELESAIKLNTERMHDFADSFSTAEEKAAALQRQLDLYRPELSSGQIANVKKEIDNILTGGIEEININSIKSKYRTITTETDKAAKSANQLGFTFSSAFEDAILQSGKLGDAIRGLGQDILRIFLRSTVTAPLGNFLSKSFTSLFKAEGGPVTGGQPYIVGERGPELFVPGSSGGIVPNDKLSMGGGSTTINISIDSRADASRVRSEIYTAMQQISDATMARVQQAKAEGRL